MTLEELNDEREVLRLAHRYAQALDRGDTAAWAELFTKDYVFGRARGGGLHYDEVVRLPELQLQRYASTWHGVQTQNVTLHGDGTAEGETYCIARHIYSDDHIRPGADPFSLSHDMLLRYQDRYRKDDGVWRFCERRVISEMRVVHHVILPPASAAGAPAADKSSRRGF